jgi:uncharacterized cupin superfamily protein
VDAQLSTEPVTGDGYAVSHLDAMGSGPGFRKIRRELGVTAFGINALIIPPGYNSPTHSHERQEEVYFVHSGVLDLDCGDGRVHRLGPGGIARVDAATVRKVSNSGDTDVVVVAIGGEGGYVGRDGISHEDAASS